MKLTIIESKALKNKGEIPTISNSSNKISNKKRINIFKIILNNPKVKILRGKVIRSKIGFKKALNKPRITPTKIKICQYSLISKPKKFEFGKTSNFTPGINFEAKNTIKIPAKTLKRNFFIYSLI
jgi:hypothetical protein